MLLKIHYNKNIYYLNLYFFYIYKMIFILFNYIYEHYFKEKRYSYDSLDEIVVISKNIYSYNYNDKNIYEIV